MNRQYRTNNRRSQNGAVLIFALLIVALVAGLAVNYASSMQLVQARAMNQFYGTQQELWSDSMVPFAIGVLNHDKKASNTTDHLGEDWAMYPVSEAIEGGSLMGSLADAQALLNINSLEGPIQNLSNPTDPARFTEPQKRFIRLLQTFDGVTADPEDPLAQVIIDENTAVAITEAVVDWLDGDDAPIGYGGAESLQYQQAGVTWVPPNALMESLEELKLVQGITPEIFDAIRPFIVVLPSNNAALNINSIAAESSVRLLQTLNGTTSLLPLQAGDFANYNTWRTEEGFETTENLASNPDFTALLNGAALALEGLDVRSEYFWLNTEVQIEDKIVNRRFLLFRDDQGTKVVARLASGQSTALQSLLTNADKSEASDENSSQSSSTRGRESRSDNGSGNDSNSDRKR